MRVLFCLCLLFLTSVSWSGLAAERPNLIFIIADDLGYADVGFHSGQAPTPNLDKLASGGLELTHHYVAPVCSPTRTGLMTGRFWSRFNVTTPQNERALPWDTVTLPRALKTLGYDTAITGKWHLGSKPEWGPNHFGFDHSYGSLAGGVGPWDHHYKKGEFMETWHRNEKLLKEEGHVTDLIAKEAVQWIGNRSDKPFFLYVPFTAVHLPIREPEAWVARVPESITGDLPRQYAACIMHLDDAVGQIVAAVEKAGKRGNTMIVFTSDNGGTSSENAGQAYPPDNYPTGSIPGNNKPLRGEKAQLYEGGIRVACVASWPGKLKPGKFDAPVHISDWFPTFAGVTGYAAEKDLKWDGKNVWPALLGEGSIPPRLLYWTAPSYRASAVRDGDLKLIVTPGKNDAPAKTELFNVAVDPEEKNNLAASEKDKVTEMLATLKKVAASDKDSVVEGPKTKE